MGSRSTRIVVPAIGLLAVTGALALVATAPLVLFPSANKTGKLPSAPDASREVARVVAHALRPSHERHRPEGPARPVAPSSPGPGLQTVAAPAGGIAGNEREKREAGPALRGGAKERAGEDERKGKGKGKAKGHAKHKHHGKAKGHTKQKHPGRVAFAHSHGAKSGHIHRPGAGGHTGRRPRAHARARR